MAKIREIKTPNKILFDTIRDLKKMSNKTGVPMYKAVAVKLSSPASQRSEVNLSKLDKVVLEGETVIVPGKILGTGLLNKKITIIGFSASENAKVKINKAGSKFIEIKDYLKGKQVQKIRIIG